MMLHSNGLRGLGIDMEPLPTAGSHSAGISWETYLSPECFRYLMTLYEDGWLFRSITRESIEYGNPGGYKFSDFAPGGRYSSVSVYDVPLCAGAAGAAAQQASIARWQALPSGQYPSTAVAEKLAAQAATASATVAANGTAKAAADAAAQAATDAAKKIAATGGAAAGFDLSKFLKDNQTLLLIGAAGLGALFLLQKKKGAG